VTVRPRATPPIFAGGEPPGARRSAAPRKPCYDQAVALLGQRSHFESELRLKLARRGHPESEVAGAFERLRREGYLDDRRAAEEWLRVHRRRGDGPRRLAAGLGRLGVPRATIGELLAAAEEGSGGEREGEDEAARAKALAERWIARHGARSGTRDPGALARHLDRRGFGRRAILSVLAELQLPARDVALDEEAPEPGAG
jgi:regulatory protein